MTKAVIFDCFGVLYGESQRVLLAMCPQDKRQELLDNNKQNDYGFFTTEQYVQNVSRLLTIPPEQVIDIFHRRRVRNQPLFDYIGNLRSHGVKVALLSNAGRDMPAALFSAEELAGGLFDAYMVSSEQGIVKPNPVIFQLVADKLGVAAGDCVMVDDTPENCEGAEVAGMQSVQYVTNEELFESLQKKLQVSID